jgi:hypothetical protein
LDPATTEVNDKKTFLIGQTATKDAARPQGRQTHNQPQKKQETHNQARARAVTFRAASPVLLMQLWSHSADAAAAATTKTRSESFKVV